MKDIKLICFDLNKTLVKENTWLDLNLAMCVTKEEDDLLFRLYKDSIITYKEWQSILEKMYIKRGKATRANIEKTVFNYTYMKDAEDVVKYLKKKGYKIALITGSLLMLAEKVAKETGIEFYEANNIMIFNEDDYLEKLVALGNDELIKLRHLQSFCRELDIKLTECVCIGDGDNDRLLFEKCKHGITFKDSDIKDLSWKVINELGDLEKIF